MSEVKRITFKNSRGLNLVAHYYPASQDKIVLMSPGSCCDKSSQGRFEYYARSLNEKGISALAIDFSGCGESDDDILTIPKEVDDLKTAIHYAHSKGYTKIGLFGHSLGGLVSLMAFTPKIQTIAMIGGLTGPQKYDWDNMFTPEQKQELKSHGHVTVKGSHNMDRKGVVLDKSFFQEFEQFTQKDILERISCPVLMIHGDGDAEEQAGYEISQKGMAFLSPSSKLTLIPGANHGFWGHIGEVAHLLQKWFEEHLGQ